MSSAPFSGERLVVDTAAALLLAAGLFMVGFRLALPLATVMLPPDVGVLMYADPREPLLHALKLGAAAAFGPLAAWLLSVVHRARRRRTPPIGRLAFYWAALTAVQGLGGGLRYAWVQGALRHDPGAGALVPALDLRALSLAGWVVGAGVVAFLLLVGPLVVGAVSRRPSGPADERDA